MTTLVHTADVHLRPDAGERMDALEAVLEVATDLEADVLTIGGDLFDRPADVETLRSDLRNRLFTDLSFEVLLIPGNHDVAAFRGDLFFGNACTIVADETHFGTWTAPAGDLRVVAIPYRETADDDLLLALADREPFDGTDVLLFHGSLDAPIGGDAGDEDAYRYFPISEAELVELGFDHYLAGHYHGQHHLQFDGGAEFAYPGTPASTRSSETDRRQVVTLDTDPGAGIEFEPLDTVHHLEKRLTVTPGAEDAVLAELEEWVQTAVTPLARPSVVVEGVVDRSEAAFAEQLREIVDPEWITDRTVSVEHVTAHPVLGEFRSRLDEREWDDETRAEVWTRTLRAASRAGIGRGRE